MKLILNGDQAPAFRDVAAKDLILWKVLIRIADDEDLPILLNNIPKTDKKRLKAVTNTVFDVFGNAPDGKMIHIIVQRPPPGKDLFCT